MLSVGENRLSGEVPSCVTQMKKLQKLDLQDNQITGEIQRRLDLLTDLAELNLSSNRFTGEIPPQLGNLPVLTHLDLSSNLLTGEIPIALTRLKLNKFNISNNRLSGGVPLGFDHSIFDSGLLGNPNLCGPRSNPISLCGKIKPETLYPIFILTLFPILILGSIIWFIKTKSEYESIPKHKNPWKVTTFQRVESCEDDIIPRLKDENLIGSGGSGQVYRVKLRAGETVAVKRLWRKKMGWNLETAFKSETETLGRIRHVNIVKLLLCCVDEECNRFLVYEYMERGSLGDVLHGESNGAGLEDWHTRLMIAVGLVVG